MTKQPAGFAESYDELFLAAWALARRIVGPAGEDVAAETMVRAYVHWRRIGDKEWTKAWVLRVATNVALKTAKRTGGSAAARPSLVAPMEDVVALRAALASALQALPRRQREVVVLRYLADASEHDVAQALGVRPVTVRTHLQRGLAALRVSLGSSWREQTDG